MKISEWDKEGIMPDYARFCDDSFGCILKKKHNQMKLPLALKSLAFV